MNLLQQTTLAMSVQLTPPYSKNCLFRVGLVTMCRRQYKAVVRCTDVVTRLVAAKSSSATHWLRDLGQVRLCATPTE